MNSAKMKEMLPYLLSIILTLAVAFAVIWYTTPQENTLPAVYPVM